MNPLRHTRSNPCPICAGFDESPRGRGVRCEGFTVDGSVFCARVESPVTTAGGLYVHVVGCRCAASCVCREQRGRRVAGCFCERRCTCCSCRTPHGNGAAPAIHLSRPGRTERDDAARIESALRISKRRLPISGTPGAVYLASRGLTITPTLDEVLGFVPDLEYWQGNPPVLVGRFPAMIASFLNVDGKVTGVLLTYLGRDGRKAPVEPVKKMRGLVGGCAVRLGPIERELHIAEGIESALSISQALGVSAWAAGSAGGIAGLELPPEVRAVVLWPDRDDDGAGLRGAQRGAARLVHEGRNVRIAELPAGTDPNDLIQGSA